MFFNATNITNTKITRLANVSHIALKAHYTVIHNTNVPGILRCKNYGAIIKYNSGKSKLGLSSPISICCNVVDMCRIYATKAMLWGIRRGFFNKTNRAKIKSSHVLLIFQSFIFVFCTFLLGFAMVKYCAVAVCRNGTHNRPDLTYFAFPEDNTRRRKWIVFCKRADKKFKSLVYPRICSLHF